MKRFSLLQTLIVAIFVAVCMFLLPGAQATPVIIDNSDATEIREAAILTTSDVLSTTFSLNTARVTAVHVYVDFTKGSLTNAIVAPAGAMDDNPDSTGYYKNPDEAKTITADGTYHFRIPKEEFGASNYAGFFVIGTGTVTSSEIALSYKLERIAP